MPRSSKRLAIEEPVVSDESEEEEENSNELLSEYEMARIANIRKNEQYLASLGLNEVKSTITDMAVARKPATKKGISTKRVKIPVDQLPVRRSGRVTTERLKVELEDLQKTGATSDVLESKTKELTELLEKKNEGSYEQLLKDDAGASSWYRSRLDSGPLLLLEQGDDDTTGEVVEGNKKMLKMLNSLSLSGNSSSSNSSSSSSSSSSPKTKQTTGKGKGAKASKEKEATKETNNKATPPASTTDYIKRIKHMKLQETDVAKLVKDRIVSVLFHPSPHKVVLFAGDKSGNMGVWDVDNVDDESSGVYTYQPHVSNISKFHVFPEDSCKVYSVSYDGTIRCLDATAGAFLHSFEIPETIDDVILTDASFMYGSYGCNSAALLAKSDGCIGLVDFRASNKKYRGNYKVQDSKVNSVQQHPTEEHLVVTAGMGVHGCISIHDMRKLSNGSKMGGSESSAMASWDPHTKSINAAYVSPDGQCLVSVSQDNTIKTFENYLSPNKKDMKTTTSRHDNHTGRWLSTFKPTFDPKQPAAFVMGSMLQPRGVEIFNINRSKSELSTVDLVHTYRSPFLASVCSRNDIHPSRDIIACGNSSGRIHVLR